MGCLGVRIQSAPSIASVPCQCRHHAACTGNDLACPQRDQVTTGPQLSSHQPSQKRPLVTSFGLTSQNVAHHDHHSSKARVAWKARYEQRALLASLDRHDFEVPAYLQALCLHHSNQCSSMQALPEMLWHRRAQAGGSWRLNLHFLQDNRMSLHLLWRPCVHH